MDLSGRATFPSLPSRVNGPNYKVTSTHQRSFAFILLLVLLPIAAPLHAGPGPFSSTHTPIIFSDDGGWCWFEDPRAIVHPGKLIIGTVANGRHSLERKRDIEAIVYDLKTGEKTICELHDRLQADDHNSPVFLARPDGRVLTVYAKHGPENRFYYRISKLGNPAAWGPIQTYSPSPSTRLTYQNLFQLSDETNRIYNFFRGLHGSFKPSFVWSDDGGHNWQTGQVIIRSPAARPYVRYASNARDTIHLLYTEGHPRDFDNSLYHIFYREGSFHRSDGTPIAPLQEGIQDPAAGTRIFQGGPDHVAWCADIRLDPESFPYVAYSVQMNSAGLPPRQGGTDHRYRYARWDGQAWQDHQLAFAGSRLYPGEDDYTGLVALHPTNPDLVFISTNVDPANGQPLVSSADDRQHWEIFQGVTNEKGKSWQWSPVTRDSTADNLRPIIPNTKTGTILLWLRGTYHSYTDYDLEVVGLLDNQ